MKYIIANWKANKNLSEAKEWIKQFNVLLMADRNVQGKLSANELVVVICPPFPFLEATKKLFVNIPNLRLGAQDLSQFESGSFTGEVTATSLVELIEYVIIGHSERRTHFNEDNIVIKKKLEQARANNIEPILCIQGKEDEIIPNVQIVAYEPVSAIGSGNNESVEKVVELKQELTLSDSTQFLYGGSVNSENASVYLQNGKIDGLLVGGISLDPGSFFSLLKLV